MTMIDAQPSIVKKPGLDTVPLTFGVEIEFLAEFLASQHANQDQIAEYTVAFEDRVPFSDKIVGARGSYTPNNRTAHIYALQMCDNLAGSGINLSLAAVSIESILSNDLLHETRHFLDHRVEGRHLVAGLRAKRTIGVAGGLAAIGSVIWSPVNHQSWPIDVMRTGAIMAFNRYSPEIVYRLSPAEQRAREFAEEYKHHPVYGNMVRVTLKEQVET